jgi:hypothetical protein
LMLLARKHISDELLFELHQHGVHLCLCLYVSPSAKS